MTHHPPFDGRTRWPDSVAVNRAPRVFGRRARNGLAGVLTGASTGGSEAAPNFGYPVLDPAA